MPSPFTSPRLPTSKPRRVLPVHCSPFTVNPEATPETLMVYLVETLASVDVMVHQLVDHLDGGSRNALLGISNSVMLAEITANRVLDQIDPRG
ncbi:DUF3077 domain-containing protein [Pseudomonas sp. IT-P4]